MAPLTPSVNLLRMESFEVEPLWLMATANLATQKTDR